MNRKGRPYTKQELEKIKELYVKGYSARLILRMIGRGEWDAYTANVWLYNIRRRLGLPKRGRGFRGITVRDVDLSLKAKKIELRIKKIEKRLKKIPELIEKHKSRIEELKKEKQQLENKRFSLLEELRQISNQQGDGFIA